MGHHILDCSNLSCPIPMVKLFKVCRTLEINDTIEVYATDAAFPHDIKAWCEQTGNRLVDLKKDGTRSTAVIQKMKA